MEESNCLHDWVETTLGTIVNLIGGGTPKTTTLEYWDGDIPWLSVVDFNNGRRWVGKTEKTITKLGLEKSSTKLLEKGDIIISARGTVGALAQLKTPMAFNQSCYGIRAKKQFSDNNFLFYLTKYSLKQFLRNVHGAVFDTITRQTFDNINIYIPPLPEQKAIASVLSSLDNKIELLREQNKTLERLAQILFKRWFVDFNFPDVNGKPYRESGGKMVVSKLGEIPEKWRVGKLGDILQLLYGKGLKTEDRTGKGFPVFGSNGIVGYHSQYLVEGHGIIIGRKGTMGAVTWCDDNFFPIDTTFYVQDKLEVKELYFHYLLLCRQDFKKLGSDSAVPGLNRDSACSIEMYIPPKEVVKDFNKVVKSLFDKQKINSEQLKSLSTLRDSLLPNLMKGEVRVNKI